MDGQETALSSILLIMFTHVVRYQLGQDIEDADLIVGTIQSKGQAPSFLSSHIFSL